MALKVADTMVAIGADLSGYRAGLKTAEKEAQTLGQQIRQALTMKNPVMFAGKSAAGNLIADLRSGIPAVKALQTAAGSLAGTFKGISVNALHAGLNGIKTVLGGLKGLASDVFKGFSIGLGIGSFQALGRAISDLVNVIPDLIARGRDYSRTVDDIADATGATTEQASKFASTLMFLGQSTGGVINMLGQMSRNLDEQGPILKRLGVAIEDVNGGTLNQLQILDNARSAMVKWGLGTTQADQIAREFGRGGLRTLVDYLHLTDEQFAKVTADARASGLILTDAQRDLGESMIREEARFQNALTGLGETIFTIVGPQIRAFFSQLTEVIQSHITEISAAIAKAIQFILGLVGALVGATGSLDSFSGAIQAANVVQSPYASHLTDLRVELAKLEDATDGAADATAGSKKAIEGQIKAIDAQITALKKLEAQQDKTYKKALDLLYAELDAQNKLLDAVDAAAAAADRDLALTRALREAKIGLFEAQAQLRKDALEGKSTDQDTLDIAKAQQTVLDAQKAITDEATQRSHDARRAELASVKDYIATVAKLLEDADNKKAALANLRTRQATLEARQQAQIAAGDTTGAGDTGLKIGALKAAEVKAAEGIANATKQTALEAQKEQLQEELANVASASSQATEIRKREINKQIADLQRQDAAWNKMTNKQKADLIGVTEQISGPDGMTGALEDARLAGIKFGDDLKTAIGNVIQAFKDLFGWIGDVKKTLDDIADNEVFKFLNQPIDLNKIPAGPLGDIFGNARGDQLPPGLLPGTSKPPNVPPHDMPEYGAGLWESPRRHAAYVDKGETVLPPSIAAAFRNAWSPQTPAMGLAGGLSGGTVPPHSHDVYMDGVKVADLMDRRLGFRSGR